MMELSSNERAAHTFRDIMDEAETESKTFSGERKQRQFRLMEAITKELDATVTTIDLSILRDCITREILHSITRTCPRIQTLYIGLNMRSCAPFDLAGLTAMIRNLPEIQQISWSGCTWIPSHVVEEILAEFRTRMNTRTNCILSMRSDRTDVPSLTHLNFSGCTQLGDQMLWQLSQSDGQIMRQLFSLDLSQCSVTDNGVALLLRSAVTDFMHPMDREQQLRLQLESFSIAGCTNLTDASLRYLRPLGTSLRRLNLSGCIRIRDDDFGSVLQHLGQLVYLNLSGCIALSDVGVSNVSFGCAKLRHLDLSGCSRITDISACPIVSNCVNLTVLLLVHTKVSSRTVFRLAVACPQIRKLDLSFCASINSKSISSLARGCAKLRDLSLSGCGDLDEHSLLDVAQHLNKLRKLNISNCYNVSPDAITALSYFSPMLEELSLQGCYRITDDALLDLICGCSKLCSLSLSCCPQITSSTLNRLLRAKTQLRYIDVRCSPRISLESMNAIRARSPQLNIIS